MSDFHLTMEQLCSDYRQNVAVDLQALREHAQCLCGDERDRALLQEMAATLHRIAGGAGVFGLVKLSEHTHDLELDLNDWLAAPLGAAYRESLSELRIALAALAPD